MVEAVLKVIISNDETISEQDVVSLIDSDIDSSLLSKPAILMGGNAFLKLVESSPSSKTQQISQVLSEMCNDVDDEQIQTLLNAGQLSVIARWLRGRKDVKSDALLWQLMDDDRLATIDKSRLLERLIGRAGEPDINEKAADFASRSDDALLKLTAENLSTAADELNS